MPKTFPIVALALGLLACGDGGDAPAPPPERAVELLPDPGPLEAGVAERILPVPVGVGTMGYGAIGNDTPESVTPFADEFPGTVRQHTELSLKAVALSRGPAHEVIFVRADTVGIFQQLREAVLVELESRTGRDFDDALIIAGNHTHSGPGRLLQVEGTLTLLGDTFFPELYDRIVGSFADVVEDALADLRPAEIGTAITSSTEGHRDRRCENDALDQLQENPDLPLVVVRREGTIDAVVASYAYHGTVLGLDDLTLSGDMGSVVEQKIAERFDHPVEVLFFNSWGGDMAPGQGATDPESSGADLPSGFEQMEQLGVVLADAILPAVEGVSFTDEAEVRARTYRTHLDREAIGYSDEEFYYPNGGVFCGLGGDGNCDDDVPNLSLDRACLGFDPDEPAPPQTLFTAGRIGDFALVTAPGEWSTALAAGVTEKIRAASDLETLFVGYAQDYSGYSLGEDDWWQGGYETSGGMWGPRQGDYLASRAVAAFDTFLGPYVEPTFDQPAPLAPFSGYSYEPYAAETPVDLGTVVSDAPATVAPTDIVEVTVLGGDPWLGTPVAILERDDGEGFQPVVRANGTVVDSHSYAMWVDLTVEPPYAEAAAPEARAFSWTFALPLSRRAASAVDAIDGPHRLRILLPSEGGDQTVTSATFEVM